MDMPHDDEDYANKVPPPIFSLLTSSLCPPWSNPRPPWSNPPPLPPPRPSLDYTYKDDEALLLLDVRAVFSDVQGPSFHLPPAQQLNRPAHALGALECHEAKSKGGKEKGGSEEMIYMTSSHEEISSDGSL